MSLLTIKNLKKSFNDNVVLKDISLQVDRARSLPLSDRQVQESQHCFDA